jgi:methionine synthase I (cobalamin-dependent)
MTFEQGTSLTGTTPEIFAETMQNLGVDALGLNCGLGPEQMAPLMERFLACSSVPVLAPITTIGRPICSRMKLSVSAMSHLVDSTFGTWIFE